MNMEDNGISEDFIVLSGIAILLEYIRAYLNVSKIDEKKKIKNKIIIILDSHQY